jgi:hypothetical protein
MRPITVSVGPNVSAASVSQFVRFDDYAPGMVAIQCNVTGTVNATVQSSLDDSNDQMGQAVAIGLMNWVNSSDTAAVGFTATVQTNFLFAPKFARILLNSGTGSVTATFLQAGSS